MGSKVPLFGKKYQYFLSEASNDEIVRISKELSDDMAVQAQSIGRISVLLMCIESVLMMIALFFILFAPESTDRYSNVLTLIRFGTIGVLCFAVMISLSALINSFSVSSTSSVMWRNIKEKISDESAYEQMTTINRLNKCLFVGRRDIIVSAAMSFVAIAVLSLTYIIGLMVSMGYL